MRARPDCCQLLGELLLDRHNFTIMTRYISNPDNLKLMMNMLREKSRNIQFEAFHVFKVRPPRVSSCLPAALGPSLAAVQPAVHSSQYTVHSSLPTVQSAAHSIHSPQTSLQPTHPSNQAATRKVAVDVAKSI